MDRKKWILLLADVVLSAKSASTSIMDALAAKRKID
jgi:hypothetical protein